MKVRDLILYQVATDRNYKVGDKIHFGEDPNGQEYNCFNLSFNKNGQALHEIGFTYAKKGVLKDKNLVVEMSKALSNYDFLLREFALEDVRKKEFPNLPSRFRCMFLSESEDVSLHDLQGFINRGAGTNLQVVKVKCSGEAHFVKDFAIGRQGLSFNEYKELARKYWAENNDSKIATKEILFVGDVEVVEILKEVNLKEKN